MRDDKIVDRTVVFSRAVWKFWGGRQMVIPDLATIEEKFVEAVKDTSAPVVGLSGFLTPAFDAMKETVEALEGAGLRDKVKIMIGGGQMDEEVKKYAKADAYGKDAMAAVTLTKQWLGVN